MTPPRTLDDRLVEQLRKALAAYDRTMPTRAMLPPPGSAEARANTLASYVRDLLAAIDAPQGPTL